MCRAQSKQLLEFNTLKEIVSGFTTCAPGRRATEALAREQGVARLGAEFALVGEAMAFLRGGAELGFGSLVDPEGWLARLGIPGSVLPSAELLGRGHADGKCFAGAADVQRRCGEASSAERARRRSGGFASSRDGDPAGGAAERRDQR